MISKSAPTRVLLPLLLPWLWFGAPKPASAQPDDTLRVRIVDVGPGLCTITQVPGGGVMVYDAGHWQGNRCIQALQMLVPEPIIDLLVLSHSDSDHLGDIPAILQAYRVRQILWTGYRRPGIGTWESANDAIAEEVRLEGASVRSLATQALVPGEIIPLGKATVTLLAGWDRWDGPGLSEAERRNVISVVLRLDYGASSVLFTGDTVGRRIGDPPDACRDAEAWMIGPPGIGVSRLRADVMIAPHHGADNASSTCFIQEVNPEWVIFSAGHQFSHPRANTAERYLAHGISPEKLLRTDRGDDEGRLEWSHEQLSGCRDPRGDDDIEIKLLPDGVAAVDYVQTEPGC